MIELTYLHFIYLAVIVLVIFLLVIKHDVVLPCILGLFIIGCLYGGGFDLIRGAQTVFNGMMAAGTELFDIMLVIALMVAMLKCLENMGADRMMIAPATKLFHSPTMAFWVIAGVMYICATFFWPTPATTLVGTILIPVAMKAGLKPMMACMALNLAGHGMALSSDLVLQGAAALTSSASGVPMETALVKGGVLGTIAGAVALVAAFILYNKEIRTPCPVEVNPIDAGEAVHEVKDPPKYAKFFAIVVPLIFLAILVRIVVGAAVESVPKIFGGDATALYRREKTGKGDKVDVSLLQIGAFIGSTGILNGFNGRQLPRDRYDCGHAGSNTYQGSDGEWLYLAVIDYRRFPEFCELIGMPEIAADPKYSTSEAYYRNKAELTRIFDGVFAQHPVSYWDKILEEHDLPHEVLRHFKDVPNDPQAIVNHYVHSYEYSDGTKTVFVNGPAHFGSVDPEQFSYTISGPIGQDTAEVLKELGYSEEKITVMYEAKEIR